MSEITEMQMLVKRAMGNRSPFKFSKILKISNQQLENILKGVQRKPVSIDIIKKIAIESQNRVTINELLIASGYQEEIENTPNSDELSEIFDAYKNINGRYVNVVEFKEYIKKILLQYENNEKKLSDDTGIPVDLIEKWSDEKNTEIPEISDIRKLCMSVKNGFDTNGFIKSLGYDEEEIYRIDHNKVSYPENVKDIIEKAAKNMEYGTPNKTKASDKNNVETKEDTVSNIKQSENDIDEKKGSEMNDKEIKKNDMKEISSETIFHMTSMVSKIYDLTEKLKSSGMTPLFCDAEKGFSFKDDNGNTFLYDVSIIDKEDITINDIYMIYGKIASKNDSENYIIVIPAGNAYELFTNNPPVFINKNIYVSIKDVVKSKKIGNKA